MSDWPDILVAGAHQVLHVRDGTPLVEQRTVLAEGFGLYYGLTWDAERVYGLGRGCQVDDETPTEPERVIALDTGRVLATGWWHSHQMLCHNGLLYVCACLKDAILIYDIEGDGEAMWNWTGCATDEHHINSIWIDEHIWVVQQAREYGQVMRFSPTLELVREYRVAVPLLHNVYVEDGLIYTLSSVEKRLVAVDADTGEERRENRDWGSAPADCWLRGLARTDDAWYVGISRTVGRENRCEGSSWVVRLDNDLRCTGVLEIPKTGQIGDIRVTSQTDHAHNGAPFPAT